MIQIEMLIKCLFNWDNGDQFREREREKEGERAREKSIQFERYNIVLNIIM